MPFGQQFAQAFGQAAPTIGAGIGTAFGPIGTGVGMLGGSLLSSLLSNLQGMAPEEEAQRELLQQLRDRQNVDFAPIEQREMQRYGQETIPGIAERFTGMGGQRSSAFGQSLRGGGQDLAERLAALRAGHEVGQQGVNMARLGALSNYLGGQQQLQQQQNQFSRQLGTQQQYQMGQYRNQQRNPYDVYGQGTGLGLGQQYQPTYTPGTPGLVPQAINAFTGGMINRFTGGVR